MTTLTKSVVLRPFSMKSPFGMSSYLRDTTLASVPCSEFTQRALVNFARRRVIADSSLEVTEGRPSRIRHPPVHLTDVVSQVIQPRLDASDIRNVLERIEMTDLYLPSVNA